MKKKRIILAVCFIAFIGIAICGVLFVAPIYNKINEEKEILAHLKDTNNALKENNVQEATISFEKACAMFEQSAYNEDMDEIKSLIEGQKIILEELKSNHSNSLDD